LEQNKFQSYVPTDINRNYELWTYPLTKEARRADKRKVLS